MKELVFFKDEFEVKVCLANLLEKVAYKEMEAISYALNKWDTLEKEKEKERDAE